MPEDEEDLQSATLDSNAITDHEMYMSWVRAGFTEEQAMCLLIAVKADMFRHIMGSNE